MLFIIASGSLYVLVVGLAFWLILRHLNRTIAMLEQFEPKRESAKGKGGRHTDSTRSVPRDDGPAI
jgi:hypothetical protein